MTKPLALPERFVPEDFVVEEIPAYSPAGEGAHTFVRVEKRGRTTEEVASSLARAAGVRPRDVGYAGRKDRHAVTTQWLSAPGLEPEAALALRMPGVRVLEAARHPHKLRTGHLRGNRFTITLHGVSEVSAVQARERLEAFARLGMPNRFGAQRFGREGDNAERGRAVLCGELRPRDRRKARFWVSALQSAVFNEALRLRDLPLHEVEAGDVAVVVGRGGLFVVTDVEREAERAARFEISATGPIFGARAGTRDPAPEGRVAAREAQAMLRLGLDPSALAAPPRGLRLPGGRRALRVRAADATALHEGDRLRLGFVLPPGSYATVLLEELSRSEPDELSRSDPKELS